MEEWKEYKIEDVTTVLGDGLHGTPLYDDNGNVYFINGNNLENGRIVIKKDTKKVSESEAKNYTKPLSDRTILVSINGTIGNVAKYNGEKCILGKSACYFNVNPNVDLDFIYYVVANKQFCNTITQLATGTTIKNVSLKTMRGYSFMMPSYDEQIKISSILRSLDEKIELNRRINDNLEQQAQMMFDQHLMNNTATEFCKLSDIANINPKRTVSKNTKARYIEMSNLPTKGSFPCGWEYKEFSGGMKFMNGDTLMARITPCLENGKVAFINFLNNGEIAFGSTEYIVISSKGIYSSEWFYFLTRNKTFVDYSIKHMNGSSGRQRVSGESIGDFPLPQFSKDSLKPIFLMAESALKIIKRNSLENIKLSAIRDSLLPRLMSGELKINETNN